MIYPPAAAFADVGSDVLALSVSRTPRDYILWFRPELVKTMTWAGNPEKPVEMGPNGDRLTPRKSFEAWLDTVHGRSKPWTPVEREAAEALRLSLMEVVLRRIDQVMRERTKAQEHQDFLMAELDHRVKNTLANIQALILHTRQSAESLESFTRGLERRIRAMAHAHNLLTRSRWEGADLRSLAAEELDFYGRDGGYDTVLDGPEVTLKPRRPCRSAWRCTNWRPMPANMAPCPSSAARSGLPGRCATGPKAVFCASSGRNGVDPR
jgi:chemotaxis family two-component system sensor kinase Cph1